MNAVSRLLLDHVPHVKAYWIMVGEKTAQVALAFGANDFDAGHDLAHDFSDEVVAAHHLRVFMVVAQLDKRDELPRDVAVRAPSTNFVVSQLGVDPPEGRRFC